MFHPPCSVVWLSPPLCQSVVTEVKYKLVEGVRLDLSHLLFLLFHDLHGGFLQGAARCRQLASIRHSPVAFRQACESLTAQLWLITWFCFFYVSSFLNLLYLCKLPYGQICLYTFCRKKKIMKWVSHIPRALACGWDLSCHALVVGDRDRTSRVKSGRWAGGVLEVVFQVHACYGKQMQAGKADWWRWAWRLCRSLTERITPLNYFSV